MPINWELGVAPDIIGNALQARRDAQDRRQQQEYNNALLQMKQQEFASSQQKNAQTETEAAHKRALEQAALAGKLATGLKSGQIKYDQAVSFAQQQGFDISKIPAADDPGLPAWLDQQIGMAQAIGQGGVEALSGIAKELQDAGYKPGTPEFEQAARSVISNKYASDYVDEAGNTRRRSALNLGGNQPATIPPGAVAELKANPGTATQFDQIFGPGSAARILGGPTPPASGSFRP